MCELHIKFSDGFPSHRPCFYSILMKFEANWDKSKMVNSKHFENQSSEKVVQLDKIYMCTKFHMNTCKYV